MSDPKQLLDDYAAAIPPITALEPREATAPKAFAALRAVLDLHKPQRDAPELNDYCAGCSRLHRSPRTEWPCETVRVISSALEGA